jgi:methyl-accepting chemotaxis protein
MNQLSTIEGIRSARNAALAALDAVLDEIDDEIAQTTKTGPYLDQLTKRKQDLNNEYAAISMAATEAVLALPEVIAAAATLNTLSAQMKATAQQLVAATNVLNKTAAVLALGQQFSDVIANAHRG